jgi:signal transduction histidine kinase
MISIQPKITRRRPRELVMLDYTSPHQKLLFFLERIGISEDESRMLEQIKPLFLSKRDAFARYFYDFFLKIDDTRHFLVGERKPEHMKRVWAGWFAAFFQSKADDDFVTYLWGVGVRHVEVSLDQRFSNLGFAMIRQFCHQVVASEVPVGLRGLTLSAINKKLDLCLLAETTAYIENTISCDIEVMQEVADRVRNPAMVIGWNIRKLQGRVEKGTKEYDIYQMLMSENQRLENMVKDIKVYMDVFQGEPEPDVVSVDNLIATALEKLRMKESYPSVRTHLDLQEDAVRLKGDRKWMEYLFYYLLENSLEAAGQENGFLKISSKLEDSPPFNIRIEILNSGVPPADEAEKLFAPFFSTKVEGTGFGLPIARLIARKHHGTLSIQGEAGVGTKVAISLPHAEKP